MRMLPWLIWSEQYFERYDNFFLQDKNHSVSGDIVSYDLVTRFINNKLFVFQLCHNLQQEKERL